MLTMTQKKYELNVNEHSFEVSQKQMISCLHKHLLFDSNEVLLGIMELRESNSAWEKKDWIYCQKVNDYKICIYLYSESCQHERKDD